MKRPRWAQRLLALAMLGFWMPCPVCGRKFGEHEWDGRMHWRYGMGGDQVGSPCCPECPGSEWPHQQVRVAA